MLKSFRFLITASISSLLLLCSDGAYACSPADDYDPKALPSLDDKYAVFFGRVQSVTEEEFEAVATFRVLQVWKGPKSESLTVATDDQASCGLGKTFFKEGHYYLVYAYGEPRSPQLGTGLFSGTKQIVHAFGIWHAPPDLMVLGPGSPVR